MERNLLATYGTLRKGHGNFTYFLDGIDCVIENDIVRGFQMGTFGGFPAIFRTDDPEDTIVVDVFDMTQAADIVFEGIDRMEKGAGYDREVVTTESGREVMIYTMPDTDREFFSIDIPSGDWNTYQDRRYA